MENRIGSFAYCDGLTDRIFNLKDVRKYYGFSPLVCVGEDARGISHYQAIPGLGVNITTNRTTKKCSAEIKQIQTLDHIIDPDKLHSKLERRLGAVNYWPHSTGLAIGCGIAGCLLAMNPLVGLGTFVFAKTSGAGKNRFYNKVPRTDLVNGSVQYEIDAPTQGGIAKAKVINGWNWLKHKVTGSAAPTYVQPEKYHRVFVVAPLDTENYIIKYEAQDVPRGVIVRDMDQFRRGFVAAQRKQKWWDALTGTAN